MRIADYSANFLEMLAIADDEEKVARLVDLHKEWGLDVSNRASGNPLPPIPARAPGAKLKIGLMSSDLRNHSVAKFVLPILQNYDAARFELYCYSPFEEVGDPVQSRIRSLVSEFRIVDNVSDREFAEIVRTQCLTTLMVTHDLPYALELCSRALIMNEGRIVADGPIRTLLADAELLAANRLELPPGYDPARA